MPPVLAVGGTVRVLGEVAGYVVQYPLLLLLPANVMRLGLTNSLLASLNLVALVGVVRVIGWGPTWRCTASSACSRLRPTP